MAVPTFTYKARRYDLRFRKRSVHRSNGSYKHGKLFADDMCGHGPCYFRGTSKSQAQSRLLLYHYEQWHGKFGFTKVPIK